MKVGIFAKACTVGAAVAMFTAGLVSAPAAMADPSGTPALNASTLAGYGSDTTQDVMNALTTAVNDAHTADGAWLASYNALDGSAGTTTIANPKGATVGGTVPRANGSGNGLKLLRTAVGELTGDQGIPSGTAVTSITTNTSSLNPGGTALVNFGRSSSDRADSTHATDGIYSYVPFAKDAVALSVNNADTAMKTLANHLTKGASGDSATTASVYSIYHCLARYVYTTAEGAFDGVGAAEGDAPAGDTATAIVPILPKAGSGTRTYFIKTIAGYSADVTAGSGSASCVKDKLQDGTTAVQEHNGAGVADWSTGAIAPFSIPQWIAQSNSGSTGVTDHRSNVVLLGATDASAVAQAPIVDGATNPAFPFVRTVFNVLPYKKVRLDTTREWAVFNGASPDSICHYSSVISSMGFIPLNVTDSPSSLADCGYIGNRWGAPVGSASSFSPVVTPEFNQIGEGDSFDVSISGDSTGGIGAIYADSHKVTTLASNIDVSAASQVGTATVDSSDAVGSTISLYGAYNPNTLLAQESNVSSAATVKVVNPYVLTLGDVAGRVAKNSSTTIKATVTQAESNPGAKVGGWVTLFENGTEKTSVYMVKRSTSVNLTWKPTTIGEKTVTVEFAPDNSSESLNGSDSVDVTVNSYTPALDLSTALKNTLSVSSISATNNTTVPTMKVTFLKDAAAKAFPTGTVKVYISTSRTGGTRLLATANLVNGVANITLPKATKWGVTNATADGVVRYLNVAYSGSDTFYGGIVKSYRVLVTS